MTRIQYGQIGTGHAHASKLSVYRSSADFEVIGVAEDDPTLRKSAEQQAAYQNVKWMTREELLNQPGLQVVGVETPVRDLLEYRRDNALPRESTFIFDKPAGSSLPQFQRLLDNAARQQLAVQMGYMYRYNPAIVMLRDCLKKGWLGEAFEIHAVMSKVVGRHAPKIGRFSWRFMFELGCHLIDLVVGVLGPAGSCPCLSASFGR